MFGFVKIFIYCIYFLIEILVKSPDPSNTVSGKIKSILINRFTKWLMLIIAIISLGLNAILLPRALYLAYVIKTSEDKHLVEIAKIKEDNKYYINQAEISAQASYDALMLLSNCTKTTRETLAAKAKSKTNK